MTPVRERKQWSAWLAVALFAALLTWLTQRPGLAQLDLLAYDRMLPLAAQTPERDTLVVNIDEQSLAEIGRWPWSRATHARLLSRLADANARAVLFNLFLIEAGADPAGDEALAQAMTRLPVYLPALAQRNPGHDQSPPSFALPLPLFARHAAGIGHAELVLDTDGVGRQLYLRMGPAGHMLPYVGTLIAQPRTPVPSHAPGFSDDAGWRYEAPMRIAFAGPNGTYAHVSYAQLLRGEVPAEQLRGRTILVGVTASGLGDQVIAPSSMRVEPMSGIEVHANAIAELQQGRGIRPLPLWAVYLGFLALLASTSRLMQWRPRDALVLLLGAGLIWLALGSGLLALARLWLPVSTGLVGLVGLYLGWSWLRMRSQLNFFSAQTRVLRAVPQGSFELDAAPPSPVRPRHGSVEVTLANAIQRILRLQSVTNTVLQSLPVGIILSNDRGQILGTNATAQQWLGGDAAGPNTAAALRGQPLGAWLSAWSRHRQRGPYAPSLPPELARLEGQYQTPLGSHYKLFACPISTPDAPIVEGYIAVMTNITAEREAQRQRAKWNSFLSHDLRSPLVSILTQLELRKNDPAARALSESVAKEVHRTLSLAESFMDVSHAWSGRYRAEEVHLASLFTELQDRAWAQAQHAGVQLAFGETPHADDMVAVLDGPLVARALNNLLVNAIDHSPRGSTIRLCWAVDDGQVFIQLSDAGSGMPPRTLAALLAGAAEPTLGRERSGRRDLAHGLGFEFARTVINRHGGTLDGCSAIGHGTRLWITLPLQG